MKRQQERAEYRSIIADSWNRCIGYGLHHDYEPEPANLDDRARETLEKDYEALLSTTETEVLPYYNNIMSIFYQFIYKITTYKSCSTCY